MFELTPLTTLLLFVGLLIMAFLVEAIRYWHEMRQHDRAWASGPAGRHMIVHEGSSRPPRMTAETMEQAIGRTVRDHPDLIVGNLSEIERRIIADAMYRGEDLPGVGPSFAD